MKNVAGFQSLDFGFFLAVGGEEDLRSGFGIKPTQNEVCAML